MLPPGDTNTGPNGRVRLCYFKQITAKSKQVHTCSGVSLVAQWVKNLPMVQESPVRFLGWEDPLGTGQAAHSRILVCRIPMERRGQRATVHRVAKSWTRLSNSAQHSTHRLISDKQSSRQKRVTRHTNGQNIIVIQGTIHQEELTEINICT